MLIARKCGIALKPAAGALRAGVVGRRFHRGAHQIEAPTRDGHLESGARRPSGDVVESAQHLQPCRTGERHDRVGALEELRPSIKLKTVYELDPAAHRDGKRILLRFAQRVLFVELIDYSPSPGSILTFPSTPSGSRTSNPII